MGGREREIEAAKALSNNGTRRMKLPRRCAGFGRILKVREL
jgi:hypothetical protein